MDAVSQHLKSYFGANQELLQLSRKAGRLVQLQRLFEQLAPVALARASHVQQLDQQTLQLAADNGAVAAKLRQLAPQLVQLFQNSGIEVNEIQVKVRVVAPPVKHVAPPATVSAAGRQRLTELADTLPDSPLKSALQRLAAKGK
jgi:hypothetical protein